MKLCAAWMIFTLVGAAVVCCDQIGLFEPSSKQTCDYEFTTKYAPNAFYKLKDLPGVQNNGSTHLQFYVIAQENVHIKFIVNANVETTQNFIQIVLGGTLKAADYSPFHCFHGPVPFWQLPTNVLNGSAVNTVNIWITDGNLKVNVNGNHELEETTERVEFKYVSFGSWNGLPLHVYFNCTAQEPAEKLTLVDLINKSFPPNIQ